MSAEREAVGLARTLAYRTLALLFRPARAGVLDALRETEISALQASLARLGDADAAREAEQLAELLRDAKDESLRRSYEATFEPDAGLRCAPLETSLVPRTPQEGMVRTFEMADVAGFYRAFGVEMKPGTERPDHVAAELEFMHLLALKEVLALREEGEGERADVCRDAARSFLRDHLGRFAPRLRERLEEVAVDPIYAAAGRILERFVAADAERMSAV